MFINSRQNLLEFNFPRSFMPEHISNKYRNYLNRIPGNTIRDPLSFLNYTIQGLNIPGIGYDAVEQNKGGTVLRYRDSVPEAELVSKEMTIRFQLVDGLINYWMMRDILKYYYSFEVKKRHLDNFNVRMTDSEGHLLVTSRLIKPIYNNIGDLDLDFSNNVAEFTTFECTFEYNDLEIILELD